MAKFDEAMARLFKNKFVCKECKSTIRAPVMAVLQEKISYKKFSSRSLRTTRMN
jgi:ribosomal protein L40E